MNKLVRIGGARVEHIDGIGPTVRGRPFKVIDSLYEQMITQPDRFLTPEMYAQEFPEIDMTEEE